MVGIVQARPCVGELVYKKKKAMKTQGRFGIGHGAG